MLLDPLSDPFGERSPKLAAKAIHLLGAQFEFQSNDRELLGLVGTAYDGLPRQSLSPDVPEMRVELLLSPSRKARQSGHARPRRARSEPPPLEMLNGAGMFAGATESSNFVVISPREHAALVVVSPPMLRFPYHTRYELIEFAVYTLAARAQGLIPLHAACVGRDGRGILLMGTSGAGKSTVALHCALAGLEFLSEDSVFVAAESMLATGVANFLHVGADSVRWLGRSREAAAIRKSPVIRRRSGVKKFAIDLRRHPYRLAQSALQIVGVVFLSKQIAAAGRLLEPLTKSALRRKLAVCQAYGARQPHWRTFSDNLSDLGAFELRRGRDPLEAVDVLRSLLARPSF
jgi:hypothetical protein